MIKNKKTFFTTKHNNTSQLSHNKKIKVVKNNFMIKETNSNNDCKIHVMPPAISDADITALFNGLLNVVKKKIELDNKSVFINMNSCMEKLSKELKEKQSECNRLKNEILFLKSQLKN